MRTINLSGKEQRFLSSRRIEHLLNMSIADKMLLFKRYERTVTIK